MVDDRLELQPDGSAVLTGDPASGGPTGRVLADAPGRQFPIVVAAGPAATAL